MVDIQTGKSLSALPNRTATFIFDHTICKPGAFDEDFTLTLRALSPADEIKAAQIAKGDTYATVVTMARLALHAVNGFEIDRGQLEDEQLWNDLDQAGRNLVISMWTEVGTSGSEAVGKARASLQIG